MYTVRKISVGTEANKASNELTNLGSLNMSTALVMAFSSVDNFVEKATPGWFRYYKGGIQGYK